MWRYQLTIKANQAGRTVKEQLMAWNLPQRLRGGLRIARGIRINGILASTAQILQVGDKLTLDFPADIFRNPAGNAYPGNDSCQLDILYENDSLVLVDKPAGMKMHPHSPTERDTLFNYLAAQFKRDNHRSAGQAARPYMIHRLDRATSGLVLVAKNPVVVPILNAQLRDKIIRRRYLAWVSGKMPADAGLIDQGIGIDPDDDRLRKINGIKAQSAQTQWTLLEEAGDASLLELELETGRMHQIRVHLAAKGHPIIGDDWYGGQPAERLMLHSYSIDLPLPFSDDEEFHYTCPPRSDFKAK
ncbi:RluA family pseudouridine synthase [Eupransor demetentiae]|uniref:RNA pseudouridylate synthase n=1 Tax=Eupransor demetentiae TaxID=3109584 RepID=A0ABM9N6N9_9LACO|nr:23S rRNA- or tRNA-specific (RluA) [Lactobacillaceae bacterium LMG 33000]